MFLKKRSAFFVMVWWLFKRDDRSELKDEIKQAFSAVKHDLKKASDWITHLNSHSKQHSNSIEELNERLSSVENELNDMKGFLTFFSTRLSKQVFKQQQTGVHKQTAVQAVQTGVQTAVQTAFLSNLSVMERAIVWVLLNTDMKLSYEDVAAILNKEKSTIRGQINSIKQKNEGLIDEAIEKNGKKRYYIAEEMREMLLSKIKAGKKIKKSKK